jgi:hypothetical protein
MRSSRLPIDLAELDKFLVEIRESSPYNEINANPFFYLVKPTEENLLKYKVRRPRSKKLLAIEYIKLFPLIFIRILFSLILSVFSLLEFRPKNEKSFEKSEYLFLSHFTYAQDPKKEDIFYGENLNFKESYTFYLNHTRSLSPQIAKRFNDVNKRKVTVNTKSLSPFSMIKLHTTQFRISWWLFTKSLGENSLGIEKKRILTRAASFQHGRSTMANLVLKSRLSETILRVKPKILVLTIEGHAHEKMVVDVARSLIKDIKIIGYQHAPIVPGQLNLFRIVSNFHSNDYFLTTGEITQSLALAHGPNCRVDILGSVKAKQFEYQQKDSSKVQVLVSPEGTKESLTQSISLINEIAPVLPNVRFVLRYHPALGRVALRRIEGSLLPMNNVVISSSSLNEDLRKSHLVLFRSSAIGIEGLSYGALPMHINKEGHDALNPLVDCGIESTNFQLTSEIVRFIEKFDLRLSQDESFQRECYKIFNRYFGKLRNVTSVID